jgi:carboxypeptidase PM20D1
MDWWLYVIIGVGGAVAMLALILFIRALAFNPKKVEIPPSEPVDFDKEKAVKDLQDMIKLRTVSRQNKEEEEQEQFDLFERLLRERFPILAERGVFEKVGERALLFKIPGAEEGNPAVFMAHYDVVPALEKAWKKDPFGGEIENDVLWGRGALDTKISLNAIMQASETLLCDGFTPLRDVYLAFAGDEEIAGTGAQEIIALFEERHITPAFVLDEGGAVVQNVFPGVNKQCALIGIAEKGMMDLLFETNCGGGHASAPPAHTGIGKLSNACVRMENNPYPFRLTKPVKEMFDTLGRHSSFGYKFIFANLWLFKPILNSMAKKKGGEMNALMRTTCAFTQMEGSRARNVLPPDAKMVANFRIIGGDTPYTVLSRAKKTIRDKKVSIKMLYAVAPSRESVTDCQEYKTISNAISSTFSKVVVSPYLMVACSDSRHYGKISDKVYRFSPMALTNEERATIHGNDERVPVATIYKSVEFYMRLLLNC